jgi:hypothetical protein
VFTTLEKLVLAQEEVAHLRAELETERDRRKIAEDVCGSWATVLGLEGAYDTTTIAVRAKEWQQELEASHKARQAAEEERDQLKARAAILPRMVEALRDAEKYMDALGREMEVDAYVRKVRFHAEALLKEQG